MNKMKINAKIKDEILNKKNNHFIRIKESGTLSHFTPKISGHC